MNTFLLLFTCYIVVISFIIAVQIKFKDSNPVPLFIMLIIVIVTACFAISEINPSGYQEINQIKRTHPELSPVIENALENNKISNYEKEDIQNARNKIRIEKEKALLKPKKDVEI